MVRNVDDLDFCLSSHPQSILEGLRSLCSHPKLVDVTLSAGGRDFPCHRAVLALCSMYFRCMFSGDFVESIAARVELHDVDPDILSCLLDFAYTEELLNTGQLTPNYCPPIFANDECCMDILIGGAAAIYGTWKRHRRHGKRS
uniref:BTB domain-containing protein n=1 Tax=Monopterus albus TaxID=43700 RepID=A0A3Q3J799_MONAL